MKINPPANPNYAAVIVVIPAINKLEGCDNIVGAPLLGFQAIVSKDHQPGDIGVVFTAETQLSEEFARTNNLHRDATLNADPEATGYLEANRRVRAIKLRKHRSDALFLPLAALAYTGVDPTVLQVGDTFDELNGHPICAKYEVRPKGPSRIEKNKVKVFTRVDQRHFPVHFDSDNYWRVRDGIPADAQIVVSQKLHGTSWRGANTVVARELTWRDRIAKRLGVTVQETSYDHVFGSRRVLKDVNNPRHDHFYKTDIWSEVGARLGSILPEGFMLFGELIGWEASGEPIQRDYTYAIPQGLSELYIYRVAQVNPQGRITDLQWDQMIEFCRDHALKTVPLLWRGRHADFNVDEFMDIRYRDVGFADALSLGSNKKIVDEGVCVRVDGLVPYIAKAKSPQFFAHETKLLDKGEVDLESLGEAA
ncbi:RNA ligase family protein [Nocardia brasiliensis]|uniref:RNA ligase family protein n=1 Tax=Nocardia brasiliensis TaxID=37326 RepID=UPI002457EFDD|nr:RNA ligase family protein [Nocardia brasiliensis]